MASRPGGMKEVKDITPEVKELVLKVKTDIESKANQTFTTFEPISFATQVVAGTNYFVNIKVGENKHIHCRIFQDLKRNLSVHSVKTEKSSQDALEYF